MIRWKFTYDKDEEQDWLNEYARQGWAMTKFWLGVVTFVPCRPGEYIYQIDLLPGKGLWADDYEGYVIFMNEMGVEVLQRWGRWVYLRKRAEEGPFVLYTDVESSIEHYQKIKKALKIAVILEIVCILMEVISAAGGTDRESVMLPLAGCCLLAAIVVIIVREICRVNAILAELRARIGQEEPSGCRGNHSPSLILCLGIVLNGICLAMPEPGGSALYGFAKGVLQGIALILMGAGIAITVMGRRE